MNLDQHNGTTVMHHEYKKKPPATWRSWFIGRPLPTADAPHQTIGKAIGLAVFASDALSSTAYATQEMMVVLIAAGTAALSYSIPISFAIVVLLVILTISYQQTIYAYPKGGGSYIVSRDNIGKYPSLVAASALLMDYILTVAVSISSGIAQITSAFPGLYPYRVWVAVAFVLLIMMINLRGVKESGITFSIPTYFFVVMMYLTVIIGFYLFFTGNLGVVVDPPEIEAVALQPITFFLILRAFSNGTSAVTGVEAISDGIMAFREPRSKNAGTTLIIMAVILGSLLLGITFLSYHIQAIPSEYETVISQLVRTVGGGRNLFYLATISATMIILVMAANTAFADFPRLSAIAAGDGFLPRQLTYRGDRLVYSRGIVALALIASLLIILFQASVTNLIPLYAVGVFISFTMSQSGMTMRWIKIGRLKPGEEKQERGSTLRYEDNWQIKMLINGIGACITAVVAVMFSITKFKDGAWIVVILLPMLVLTFDLIHRHYVKLAKRLSLDDYGAPPYITRHRVILPIGGVHRGTLAAVRYARTLSDDITAVHVSIDPVEAEKIKEKWDIWGEGLRLVILESPYRVFLEPLLEYIDSMREKLMPNEVITILVPQFVSSRWWTGALHTKTAETLRKVLLNRNEIVITEVPYQVD